MEPRVLVHEITGEGEPIVLVPGGLTGWLSWIPHAERLSATRRVIRVQPIHNELGSAGRPGDSEYGAETEREALRMTLDHLAIKTADFAGWSGGGRALLEFVLAYPERVRTLTLVEPAAYWVLEQLGHDVDRINMFIHGLSGHEITEDDLADFLELAGFASSAAEARSNPNWDRWTAHRMALSWQSKELDRSGRSVEELASIEAPVLLVKGTVTGDWERRVVDEIGKRIPRARVVELEGDHANHIQSIDAFLAELESHLRV
ncbi:MAG: alpha/beta fold hydrolase [Actinomycetota bacterium]